MFTTIPSIPTPGFRRRKAGVRVSPLRYAPPAGCRIPPVPSSAARKAAFSGDAADVAAGHAEPGEFDVIGSSQWRGSRNKRRQINSLLLLIREGNCTTN